MERTPALKDKLNPFFWVNLDKSQANCSLPYWAIGKIKWDYEWKSNLHRLKAYVVIFYKTL